VRIYLGANVVIYLIEQPAGWDPRATAYVAPLLAGKNPLVVSDLTRLECLVRPLAVGDHGLLARFHAFFASADVQTVGLTAAVCDRAAIIRARYRYKLGDSLHLAAAIVHGCDRVVTNDARLHAFTDITVEVLP
jgi:predicted nucleic acid-binding protein